MTDLHSYYHSNDTECALRYPFDLMIHFIKQDCDNINNRITMIPKNSNGKIWGCRYDDKKTDEQFTDLIKKELPKYIDCGKIITNLKENHKSRISMTFIKKNLLFDVDASDYDNDDKNRLGLLTAFTPNSCDINSLRICDCKGNKRVCKDCWYLLSSASLILDYFIKNLLGDDTKILWVYSGNRGIHCWLKNNSLDLFNNDQREAIVSSISLDTDKEIIDILVSGNTLYTDLLNNILYPFFIKYIVSNKQLFNKLKPLILSFIKVYYYSIYDNLQTLWKGSEEKEWFIFENHISKLISDWKYQGHELPPPHLFIVMRLLYIVLDINVTKQIDHLLKLPYSIHKTTNRLSFPMTQDRLMNFNPEEIKDVINPLYHTCCKSQCPAKTLMEESKCLLKEWLK
jgi:DNA primase small subunit